MKKLVTLILSALACACMAIGFAACGGSGGGSGGGYTPSGSAPQDSSSVTPSIEVSVTFDANGGAFADGEETFTQEGVAKNSTLTAPTSPTRPLYTFAGWAKNKMGTSIWQFGTDTVTENTTLYAVWKQKSGVLFSVDGASIDSTEVFMLVDHTTDSVSLANKVVCSEDSTWKLYYDKLGQMEIPTKIAAGKSGSLANGDNEFYLVVTSTDGVQVNVYTLTVHRSYLTTVSYVDGGNLLKTENVYTGDTFTANYLPEITGYTFEGWTMQSGSAYQPQTVWSSLTLTAKKSANTYTVTYDENGGNELSTESKTVTYDGEYALAKPTRTGYTFNGWYKGSTQITDGQGKGLTAWQYAQDTTVTAKWTVNQYAVNARLSDENAGSVTGDGKHNYGKTVTLSATTQSGYTFVGWYDGEEKLTGELKYTFTVPAHAVTYTAKWIESTVTISSNDTSMGTVSGLTNSNNILGNTITITATTKSGHTFVGWYDGEEKLTDDRSYTFTISEKAVVYTAKWIKVTVVSENTTAGTVSTLNSTYKVGDSATITAITNSGYTFVGWYNGEEKLTGELSYTFTMPTENVTYTAKFEMCEEMKNFNFTSTATTCAITGIKDKTVTEIIVPDYVTSINKGAFSSCSNLQSITLPFVGGSKKTANDTYQYPFGYIFGTSSYTGGIATEQEYHGSSTSNTTSTTYYIPASLKSVTVTGGNILYGAFSNCDSLTSVTIGNGVTSIGDRAFYDCDRLTNVTIGNGVTSIGDRAFYHCDGLTSVTIGNGVTSIGKDAFYGCNQLIQKENGVSYVDKWVVDCDTSVQKVTLRENTKGIADGAFYDCRSLTSITIPDSVTTIGGSAFYYCDSLTSVTIGNGVTSIGYWAFYNCDSLTSITIPDSVTSIGDAAFEDCSSLTSITIPDSVTSIGDAAFYGCSSLTSVTIGNGVTEIGINAFYNCSSLTSVYITDIAAWCAIDFNISVDNYYSNPLYYAGNLYLNNQLVTDLIIPDGVTEIKGFAFYYCDNLTSVKIGNSVTSIDRYAFEYCSSLTSVTIGNGVTSIGRSAFYNCDSLRSIVYEGTMAEWNAISKASDWNSNTGSYTVYCTDGNLSK